MHVKEDAAYSETIVMSSEEYRIMVTDIIDDLAPTYQKLRERKKIPGSAEMDRMTSSSLRAVASLHEDIVTNSLPETYRRLQGTSDVVNYDLELSQVLKLKQEVIGTSLIYRLNLPTKAFLYGVIIDRQMRKSWACIFLKYHAMLHLQKHSITHVVFQALDGNRDTIRQVARITEKQLENRTSATSKNRTLFSAQLEAERT